MIIINYYYYHYYYYYYYYYYYSVPRIVVDSKSALDLMGNYRMYIYFFHCLERVC